MLIFRHLISMFVVRRHVGLVVDAAPGSGIDVLTAREAAATAVKLVN
jgi:hypothetical protein